MKIRNHVIVITGGTKGLGLALKSAFIANGNKVVIAARSIEKNKNKSDNNFLAIETDVRKEADVKKLAEIVKKKFKRIDIWINNAGIWFPHALIEKTNIKKVHELMEVNFFGTFYGSKYALITMRNQKKGVIVNILSSSALDGGVGSSGYCSSKFAASGFTKCLRLEAANDGINVISVYTRGMKTNFFDKKKPSNYHNFMDPKYVAKKIIENLELKKPMQDLIINSQDNK
ncbi:MAG: SDR family NAD(P)-dependent oxidoreductase [Candidatus Parcubacteria bacterium]|nr:SDR family NAD(P)-dependent oxidoreductase [Candidatus Parcubacteria bacterium]